MNETWFVTEAGVAVDPSECSRKNGALVHKSGAKIAMRAPDCPRSRSVDPEVERAKSAPKKPPVKEPDPPAKDLKPEEPKKGYKTRETKAD